MFMIVVTLCDRRLWPDHGPHGFSVRYARMWHTWQLVVLQ